jgi:hypothetical protein
MSDIEKARQLFRDAGLAFPTIPEELAEQLKEHGQWLFSTRPIDIWPYMLQDYLDEVEVSQVKDYAVLSHSGHGVNSYAIQYYLVHGSLHMFLHLGWGGVYMDRGEAAATIRDCFSMADQVVTAAQNVGMFQPDERLTVVGSDFYGSYWLPPGKSRRGEASGHKGPLQVLTQTLHWLTRRQTKMQRKVSTIDPKLNLGLHELANSEAESSFRFQLRYAKQQIKDILENLDNLVNNTITKAPVREGDFCLNRVADPELTRKEDKWERAMYGKWGPGAEDTGEYVSVCRRIQTYQYPLPAFRKDRGWGDIDLLGIGKDFLPVPNELKSHESGDSPLRMVVEVAAYGFAIRKVWPKLKDHWIKAVSWVGESPAQFPANRVTLVGVAPKEYWLRCLGQLPGTNQGKFPCGAWPRFWELVDALGKWFDIHFVALQGTGNDENGWPKITGAQILDLRSLTLNSTADSSDSEGNRWREP